MSADDDTQAKLESLAARVSALGGLARLLIVGAYEDRPVVVEGYLDNLYRLLAEAEDAFERASLQHQIDAIEGVMPAETVTGRQG